MREPIQPVTFSIVIPTRNRPDDFGRALHAVLNQSYQDLEIVVVNDGSDVHHLEAYRRIEAAAPPQVRFLHLMQRTRGHGHCFARNEAVAVARGQYIGFLDDDDLWTDPDFLTRAQQALQHHEADLYLANQTARTHDGRAISDLWLNKLGPLLPATVRQPGGVYPVSVEQLLLANGFGHMNCWLVRKTLFLEVGGMDESLRYEPDLDIYMRVLDKARLILHDERVVALHHVPDPDKSVNASTANGKVQKLLFQLYTADKHLMHLTRPSLVRGARRRKGYLLKRLAEQLAVDRRYGNAFLAARQGLAVLPTLGWLARTFLLGLYAAVARR